jgi:leader peptidase (prepilin peptidase)/N-methyltransferase
VSPTWDPWSAALVCGLLCAVLGALVPVLVGRLPEPDPPLEPYPGEPPKEPYAAIAARRGLRPGSVLASAVAGAVIGRAVGWDPVLVGLVPLVPVGVALAVIDWRTRLLPSRIVLPTTALAVLLGCLGWAVARDPDDLVRGLVGLLAVRSFYWLLWRVNATGMGFGDVRLAGLTGFVLGHLGWGELLLGTYAPFLVFGLPGLLLALARRDRALLKKAFPFGPSMLVGALIGIAVGEQLLASLVAR